ncbi:hypothetical protein DOT_2010 [Desulfosporosinus sp. OT]|nr:hypothetical protein DOT_2010 [Desulfosporosinus sp. OT]
MVGVSSLSVSDCYNQYTKVGISVYLFNWLDSGYRGGLPPLAGLK